MNKALRVQNLSKSFLVRRYSPGFLGTLKALFHPEEYQVQAVKNLSFSVDNGERVAFIGPNGAGKSTTIKMLTGILYPTIGDIEVLGFIPWKQRTVLGYKIGTVFGQRSQLWYHLPPSATFSLLEKIYEINHTLFRKRLDELIEIFEVHEILDKPVSQLSLGERMRCEIVASLLHQPQILFLDEPTIGLDINAKLKIRIVLNRLSKEYGTTLFLTSHDTIDIEQICERVIILDRGSLILDSSLKELKRGYIKKKVLKLISDSFEVNLNMHGIKILENKNYHFVCEVNIGVLPIEKVIYEALKLTGLKDVTIEDPSLEEIIRVVYGEKAR